MSDQDPSEKVVEAAAAHAEAVETARQVQVEKAISLSREETKDIFVHAMREVLTTGDEATKALLIQKIPLLCVDIMTMKKDIAAIRDDLKWFTRAVFGAVIVGVVALIFKLLVP